MTNILVVHLTKLLPVPSGNKSIKNSSNLTCFVLAHAQLICVTEVSRCQFFPSDFVFPSQFFYQFE